MTASAAPDHAPAVAGRYPGRALLARLVAALLTLLLLPTGSLAPVNASQEGAGSRVVLPETMIAEGSTLDVEYLTDQPSQKNWVAIYTEDQPQPGSGLGMAWAYAPGESGTTTVELQDRSGNPLVPGDYRIEYLHDDGWQRLADPAEFTILSADADADADADTEDDADADVPSEDAAESAAEYSIELSSRSLQRGEVLTVSWQTDAPHNLHWVGVYRADMTPGDEASLMWEYTPGSEGSLDFHTADLAPGSYQVWFLAEDGYEALTDPAEFVVEGKPEVDYGFNAEDLDLTPSTLQVTGPETDGVILRENFNARIPGSQDAPEDWQIIVDATTTGGKADWEGWTFSSRTHWSEQLDLMRDRFGGAHNTIVVADGEQYDGEHFSSTLSSSPVAVEGEDALRLTFDSHYRGAESQSGVVTVTFDDGEALEILRLDPETVTSGYDPAQMNSMQEATVQVPDGAREAVFSWTFTGGEGARYWGIDSVAVHRVLLPVGGEPTGAWVVSDIQGHPHDLSHALPIYRQLAPHADGLLMAGDIVNTGTQREWNEIYEVMDQHAEILPRQLVAAIGNHERYALGGFEANRDRFLAFAERDEVWGEYVLEGPGGELPVITFGQDAASPPDVPMSTQQVQFVIDRLQHWTEQDKQVILMTHFPLGNTVSGSWLPWYSNHHQHNELLTELLGNYPNAILLSGHTHYPAELGDWTMQRRTTEGHPDGFWAVSTLAMHNQWDARGENTGSVREVVTRDINQGLTLDSYGDRVVIRAYDFGNDGEQLREVTIPNPLVAFDAKVPVPTQPEPTAEPQPTVEPQPTAEPTDEPSPSEEPTSAPGPTEAPTTEPTDEPSPSQEPISTPGPVETPTEEPTATTAPTPGQDLTPTPAPNPEPSSTPVPVPGEENPGPAPTNAPTEPGSASPSPEPSATPPSDPTEVPTQPGGPTGSPSEHPGATEQPSPTGRPMPPAESAPAVPSEQTPLPTETGDPGEEIASAEVTLSVGQVRAGDSLTVEASGFTAEEDVIIQLNPVLGEFTTDSEGVLSAEVTIPHDVEPGQYMLTVTGATAAGDAALTVLAPEEDGAEAGDGDGETPSHPVPTGETEGGTAAGTGGQANHDTLARTGFTALGIALAAMLLMAAGLILISRRHRANSLR